METIHDQNLMKNYIRQRGIRALFGRELPHFFLLHFSPGELLTTPFSPSRYLQFIVEGDVTLYDMPDEESTVTLSTNYSEVQILGDMELLDASFTPFFVEAKTDVYTLAVFLDQNRDLLLNDPVFLRYVCRCLAGKLNGAVIATRHGPLRKRVILSLRHAEAGTRFSEIGRLARSLNVSSRQLLRVLRQMCDEGLLEHTDKGVYVVLKNPERPETGWKAQERGEAL